jgi:hypothetical protein
MGDTRLMGPEVRESHEGGYPAAWGQQYHQYDVRQQY